MGALYQEVVDLQATDALEAQMTELVERSIESLADLHQWLKDEESFGKGVSEAYIGHVIDFYCQTDDEVRKARYLHDQAVVMPMLAKFQFSLDTKFVNCPYIRDLDSDRYGMLRKVRQTRMDVFREENIALMVSEQELTTQYSVVVGGLTAEWEGEQLPLPFLQAKLTHPSREIRERAWLAMRAAMTPFIETIDGIMDQLLVLRQTMAVNAGFENYRDFVFYAKNREYDLEDVLQLHRVTERLVVPVWNEMLEDRRRALHVDTLRPWDVSAETEELVPFADVAELVADVGRMLSRTDPEFGRLLGRMEAAGLLDLASRPGKAPGGFNAPLPLSGNSFIFGNAAQADWDVTVLVHELGHAFHFDTCRNETLFDDGLHRSEIAEFFSHGMEVMVIDKLEEVYADPVAHRAASRRRLIRLASMMVGPVASDLFQHWMYTHPGHTAAQRHEAWRDIERRYTAGPMDWSGFETELGAKWMETTHFFDTPFYMLEYTMSMLGALSLWQRYQVAPQEAVASYKRAAAAGYNKPIRDVYALAGVAFDFSDDVVAGLAEYMRAKWQQVGR